MANNHMGSCSHGIKIISKFKRFIDEFPEFSFSLKLQYRDLETFIRPDFVGRDDIKHVRRFEETRLSKAERRKLLKEIKKQNFLGMVTPFDEISVRDAVEDGADYLKVASCSFDDWPLHEEIVKHELPVILSCAGAASETIENVVNFYVNRGIDFLIQHCVGEYPTDVTKMNINQIEYLKNKYPQIPFGFSTHETPEETRIVGMAIAKGAKSLEKHVGVPTKNWPLNAYSCSPDQLENWLKQARFAVVACGINPEKRYKPSEDEAKALKSLKRGVFAKGKLNAGDEISFNTKNFFLAFPPEESQITSGELSKYNNIVLNKSFEEGEPILRADLNVINLRAEILKAKKLVMALIKSSGVSVPRTFDLEISHHYGLENFHKFGLAMIELVNRSYCKKLLMLLPEQTHPEQYHLKKEETFIVLFGQVEIWLDSELSSLYPGDIVTITPDMKHKFSSKTGAVIEEISSTHYTDDSYYTDPSIMKNNNRKTFVKVSNNF